MSPLLGWGALLGVALGIGLWSIASTLPTLSRPRLVDRVAPYLVDISSGARELVARRSVDPLPVLGAFLSPSVSRLKRMLGSLLGGSATLELRLRQSASQLSVEAYRSRQLLWTIGGAAAGILAATALWRLQSAPLPAMVAIVPVLAAAALITRDRILYRAAQKRIARIVDELPTVLEFLTLSLSAGEGILDALRRLSRISRGELATEFAVVVAEVNIGVPLADSLRGLAKALQLAPLTRCVEQITGALERGTPLAEVLRAQAQDARDEAKRQLLEMSGKKEVAMLVPLVFLILPVTIIFAIYPGIVVLQLGL